MAAKKAHKDRSTTGVTVIELRCSPLHELPRGTTDTQSIQEGLNIPSVLSNSTAIPASSIRYFHTYQWDLCDKMKLLCFGHNCDVLRRGTPRACRVYIVRS